MKHINGIETIVDRSLKEVKKHGSEGFPLGVYLDDFSDFRNGYICWHWHDEVQITLIIEGEFLCQVGNEKIIMKPGDSIFINSCALHQIIPREKCYGKLYSFIWKADILAKNHDSEVYKECVENILNDGQKYYFCSNKNCNTVNINVLLFEIVSLFTEKKEFYQLKIYCRLAQIWLDLCEYYKKNTVTDSVTGVRDEERVKAAMQYMQEHFDEDISLDDMAKAALVSRSELCRCFKRTLDKSPKDYLIQYRIRQSMQLLENQKFRIADISEMMGFSSPSHYGSCFRKHVGCTPMQYRRNSKKTY